METIAEAIRDRVAAALARLNYPAAETIQVTPAADRRFGDYQSNLALQLGKATGEKPRVVAEAIAGQLELDPLAEAPEIAGPGFINFRLKREFIEQRLAQTLRDPRLGVPFAPTRRRLIIEFSSPNIAKPMHVGHVRSTILGDSLARVARYLGHEVITDNHLGDWGTQFGKVIFGWKHYLDEPALAKDPIEELVRLYREADAASKTDPAVLEECRQELVQLQQGDPANLAIWRRCVELSLGEFKQIYDRLGVSFDQQLGESFYHPFLQEMVDRLSAAGVARISEGATVVFDPQISETPFMIRKSDGGFGYATTDISTLEYRVKTWHPDAIWYVVGAPQQLHFQQLFGVARRLGLKVELQHIAFGSILGEDRKLMRTRTGESVPLAELLDQAVTRAEKLVLEKNPALDATARTEIARIVGLGAIKYADLSQHRLTDYVFSWEKMLSLQGNTAPYLQNAYVRSRSIFKRLGTEFDPPSDVILTEPAELLLAKTIFQFGEVVPSVLDGFRPNALANYLYELAGIYHSFYETCPVLAAPEPARSSRLALCLLFARVLQTGLDLLGIEVPEQM
jgi:arginyl-tRNA synthetase